MTVKQSFQSGQTYDSLDCLCLPHIGSVFGRFLLLCPTDDRIQILPDCLLDKHALGILWQHTQIPSVKLGIRIPADINPIQENLASVGSTDTTDQR